MTVSRSGSVMPVTSTSPALNAIHLADIMDHLGPDRRQRWPMARPFGDDLAPERGGYNAHHRRGNARFQDAPGR